MRIIATMIITTENIILVGTMLLLFSIIGKRITYKFNIPTLLVFLTVGVLAGSEGILGLFGISGIQLDNPKAVQFLGMISLNIILFAGGLDTKWESVRKVATTGILLSTIGVFFTAGILAACIYFISEFFKFGLSIAECGLLGSMVSSTDAAAVFSILRAQKIKLKNNLDSALELESGSNDPMAYVLMLTFLQFLHTPEMNVWEMVFFFFKQMLLGIALGFLFGKIGVMMMNKLELGSEGLYPVLMIAIMFGTFSITDFVGGNGYLAIYIAGVYMVTQPFLHKKSIVQMFDGLAWLSQIVLFITLGLQVSPSTIVPLLSIGLLISFSLMLIARPLAVFLTLLPFKIGTKSKLLLSWVGIRGAVPIVFATYPMVAALDSSAGISRETAEVMFHIVFFISISSVLIQGTTVTFAARKLGLAAEIPDEEISPDEDTVQQSLRISIPPGSNLIGKRIVDIGLPENVLIATIQRAGGVLIPKGPTKLEDNDELTLYFSSPSQISEIHKCFEGCTISS